LQPRHHSFVRHEALGPAGMLRKRSRCWGAAVHAACRDSEAANSLRPSAGGANGETAPRARDCHPADRPESLLGNRACFAEPGPGPVVSGFSAHDNSGAHAPSTDSTLGSTTDQRFKASLSSRGRHRSFDLCLPWHPSATTTVDVPRSGTSISSGTALNPALPQGPDPALAQGARPCARPEVARPRAIASTLRLVGPRGLSSDTAPRCFEPVSTTDVSRHEHPCRNITFGDCPPSHRGKPAGARPRDHARIDGVLRRHEGAGPCARKVPNPALQIRSRRRTTLRSSGLQRLRA
jgi:hypothetical protein